MLNQKMLRDMGQNKWQFFSIVIMSFLGVFIFTGIGGEWAGVQSYREKYYADTNLADGWIYGEGFSDEDVQSVLSIDGVTGAEKRTYLELTGDDEYSPQIYFYALGENTICKPYVVKGEEYSVDSKGKVWLDTRFAEARGLKVGDDYTFLFEDVPFTLQIAGLVYSSEYQYYSNENDLWPDFNNIGFAYCSYLSMPMKDYIINYIETSGKSVSDLVDEFAEQSDEIAENASLLKVLSKDYIIRMLQQADDSEFLDMLPYTQIVFTSSANASDLSEDIDSALQSYAVFLTRAENEGIFMLDDEMAQHKMMSSVFPIVFLLIAVLSVVTGMNRLVSNQRTQIGTLKALGFGRAKITWHYVSYGFVLSLIGAALGCLVGPLTLPKLFLYSMQSYYTLPEWKGGFDISFLLVTIATVAACTLTTYLTVRYVLSDMPAALLRPKAPKALKLTALEKSSSWEKLSFSFKYSLRSFVRGKFKTVMGIIGTVGCMALLVCAFSCYDSMEDMETWQYGEIQVSTARLTLSSSATVKNAEAIAADIDGEIIMTSAIEARANGNKITCTATVLDGEGCYFITDSARNSITPDDSTIALTMKTANALGLSEGDEFEWHIYTSDTWVTSKITIIHRAPMTQGLVITRNTLEALGYDFEPTYVDTQQNISEYDSEYVSNVLTSEDMHSFWDNYMESMNMMIGAILFFALVLAIVVLYNIGKLNFTENLRENATLKVIGFSTNRIMNLGVIQNMVCALIGAVVGLPAGLGLTYIMCATVGDTFDIMLKISTPSFAFCAAVTLVTAFVVSLLFRRQIRRLDMVSSLKGIE